jgi:hypothetical protein
VDRAHTPPPLGAEEQRSTGTDPAGDGQPLSAADDSDKAAEAADDDDDDDNDDDGGVEDDVDEQQLDLSEAARQLSAVQPMSRVWQLRRCDFEALLAEVEAVAQVQAAAIGARLGSTIPGANADDDD